MKAGFKPKTKPQNQAVAFDLGSLWLKGVHMSYKDGKATLQNFAAEKQEEGYFDNPEQLAASIDSISTKLGVPTKRAVVSLNPSNSILKQTLMPVVPLRDMRKMLKIGAQNYLGQNLENHTFDCQPINEAEFEKESANKSSDSDARNKVLVGGSLESVIANLKVAFKKTKYSLEHIIPNQVGIINAFEYAFPEIFRKSVVSLIEVGHAYSSICVIEQGDAALTRVIHFGGQDLTDEVADHLEIAFDEAQVLKEDFSDEVDNFMGDKLASFVNEIEASMDFFTHTQEKDIEKVFLSGGSILSDTVFRAIASNMPIPVTPWQPADAIDKRLPLGQEDKLFEFRNQFGTSIGAALAYLN